MNLKNYRLQFFENQFRKEQEAKIKLRIQMLMHLREGYTQREVSHMLRVSIGIVPFWKARFEQEGIGGLYDKQGRGRKAHLTDEELSMLISSIEEGILMDNGYFRGFKTKDVRTFISQQFGVAYTLRHCQRILKVAGCSLQVPRPRNKRRNQEEVDRFKRDFKKNERFWVTK